MLAIAIILISLVWLAVSWVLIIAGRLAGAGIVFLGGVVLLVLAIMRLGVGFGLLSMKMKAWKSAVLIIIISLFIDLFTSGGLALLWLFVLVYLMVVKKHFF